MLRSACVYTGSSVGSDGCYAEAAKELARALVEAKLRVVYGGGRPGLMGIFAEAVLAQGGEITGVIPRSLAELGLIQPGLTTLEVVESMHERKARMAELADGFVALPGGLGTLEEALEIWTWGQLGMHEKPLGLLNVGGFFDKLLLFLDHTVESGFLKPAHRRMLLVEQGAVGLLERMRGYEAPRERKV